MVKPLPKDLATDEGLLCHATGRLFLDWAALESVLATSLRRHLQERMAHRTKEQRHQAIRTACAIYGSMRFEASRKMIKRIATEESFDENAMHFFERAFAHIGNIQKLRDVIAHQILDKIKMVGVWRFNNVVTARSTASQTTYEVKTADILKAANDLDLAAWRLSGFLLMKVHKEPFDLTPPPWQYRPSMLRLQTQSRTSPPRLPRLRRAPSRA